MLEGWERLQGTGINIQFLKMVVLSITSQGCTTFFSMGREVKNTTESLALLLQDNAS